MPGEEEERSEREGADKKRSFEAISDGGGACDSVDAAAAAPAPVDVAGLASSPSAPARPHPRVPAPCVGRPVTHSRYCRVLDTDRICIDASTSDELVWPTNKQTKAPYKSGLNEWPLWGWLGVLQGRTGRVVYVWDREPKAQRARADIVSKKTSRSSRQAGFRIEDSPADYVDKTMLLLEIDQHFVPILEEGVEECDSHGQWDEAEMCIFTERWVDQALNEYHIPVQVLAQRAHVSNSEIWAWHQHVADVASMMESAGTVGVPNTALVTSAKVQVNPVTKRLYDFLLREISCEVCSGRLCRCCFSFCGVCEQLHCKTCSADCVRCEDCLVFFDTGDWCAECGDDFCGCSRDALYCDHCKENLCSKCASILPCSNCNKGYCLIKADDDVAGCAIQTDLLWMCPDCRCVGYCKSAPQDNSTIGGGGMHTSCMEYGSVECEVCKLRVCLNCASTSVTAGGASSACARCGTERSARIKQLVKLRLKRIEEGGTKKVAVNELAGPDKALTVAADEEARASKAFTELMLMEENEKKKKNQEGPIIGPVLNLRITSKTGTVVKSAKDGTAVFNGGLTFAWNEGAGARRVQLRINGNEQRVVKIADSETCVTLSGLTLSVTEHLATLRVARAKGPWCAWSAEIRFTLSDVEGAAELADQAQRRETEEAQKRKQKAEATAAAASDVPATFKAEQESSAQKKKDDKKGKKGIPKDTRKEDKREPKTVEQDAGAKNGTAAATKKNAGKVKTKEATAAPAKVEVAAAMSSSEGSEEGSDGDDDLLRLAALSVTAKKKETKNKGADKKAAQRGSAREEAPQSPSRDLPSSPQSNATTSPSHVQQQQQISNSAQASHPANLHGRIVKSCNIETKERGSIIGDQGARIKELKKRWPNVFIYVEKDNTLTVRGSVKEDVDACFLLALFFKDKPKTWEVESWCRCGRCITEDGCAVPRTSATPSYLQQQQQQQRELESLAGKHVELRPLQQDILAPQAHAPPFNGQIQRSLDQSCVQMKLDNRNEDIKECEICFEDDINTVLMLLPCKHKICDMCFQKVSKSATYKAQRIECPFCRSIVKSHSALTSFDPPHGSSSAASGWRQEQKQHELPDFSDFSVNSISEAEHQWFGDMAAQVARAELEAAGTNNSFRVHQDGFNGSYDVPTPLDMRNPEYMSGQAPQQQSLQRYGTRGPLLNERYPSMQQGHGQSFENDSMLWGGVAGPQTEAASLSKAVSGRGLGGVQLVGDMSAEDVAAMMGGVPSGRGWTQDVGDYGGYAAPKPGSRSGTAGGVSGQSDDDANILKMMFGVALS